MFRKTKNLIKLFKLCKLIIHESVDPFVLRGWISSDIGCKKSRVWVERKSLSSLSFASYNYTGSFFAWTISAFLRYAPRVLKGSHNARPGTAAFYWLIGN